VLLFFTYSVIAAVYAAMLFNRDTLARGFIRSFHTLLTVSIALSVFLTDTGLVHIYGFHASRFSYQH